MPFVCNCAGIKSSEFIGELKKGATKQRHVYKGLERKPQCGKCLVQMDQLISIWQLHPGDEKLQKDAMINTELREEMCDRAKNYLAQKEEAEQSRTQKQAKVRQGPKVTPKAPL